jgi:hypothetical protein
VAVKLYIAVQILFFWTLFIVLFLSKSLTCFIKNYNISETGFCLRLQVKPTQLGPIDIASPYLRTIGFNQLGFPEDGDRIQSPKRCVLNKSRTMDNVQKGNICINVPPSQSFRSYRFAVFSIMTPGR